MKEKTKREILFELFFSTLYISAFTFGGGFVIVTFMKKKFVDELGWIDNEEMLDLIALAQSSPGAIAVNAAILVGWRVAGLMGMIVAVLGTIIPPMLILIVISYFYTTFITNRYVGYVLKGMQAAVTAVIMDVVCELGKNVVEKEKKSHIVFMGIAFIATFFMKINVIYIILMSVLVGMLSYWIHKRKERVL